jgi:hypothetical protein
MLLRIQSGEIYNLDGFERISVATGPYGSQGAGENKGENKGESEQAEFPYCVQGHYAPRDIAAGNKLEVHQREPVVLWQARSEEEAHAVLDFIIKNSVAIDLYPLDPTGM